jgi:thiol-disulfide isomerase/thioredoxin
MKKTFGTLSLLALSLCAGLAITVTPAQAQEKAAEATKQEAKIESISVGSPAPAIKVAKWIKGSEVKGFEKGKTYVVEFWATWCGPCRKAIPHVTELAKQYKDKVTFVGVSVWENDETYLDSVQKFVDKMGEKMDYNVAADDKFGNEGTMARTWMQAAHQNGIPASFIVNGEGKIAWIGHPMSIEKPLAEVVAGTWDMTKAVEESKKEAAAAEADQKAQQIMETEGKALQEAYMSGDMAKFSAEVDTLVGKHPELARMLRPVQFMSKLKGDEAGAYAVAKTIIAGDLKSDPMVMNQIAWTILSNKELKSPDYGVAYDAAMAAAVATKHEDGMILDTLAFATFKKGDVAKAIELETKAIEMVKKAGAEADMITEMQGRLDEFKKSGK